MKKALFAVLLAVAMPASATPIAGAIAATSGAVAANSSRQQHHATPAGAFTNGRFSEVGYLFCPQPHGRGCKRQTGSFPVRYGNPEPWIKWMKRHAGDDAVFMGLQYDEYRGKAVLYYGKEPTNDH